MSKEDKHFYEFGPYRIDPDERLLLRDLEPIPLPPKAFETLLILVRHSERVVLKDDLMKTLWPDTFVEEANLTQNVFVLRKALGESAQDPHYIVTVPGRGYRFAGKVAAPSLGDGDLVVQSRSIQRVTIEEKAQPWRWFIWAGLASLLLAVGLLGYRFYRSSRAHPAPGSSAASSIAARRSIAVLGFRNLSGRPEEGWLSTALAEMLSTELVAGEKLRLVPGEDIARTKLDLPLADADSLSKNTLARLHNNLGNDLVVLGSYTALGEKSDGRIRLDLRLQDTIAGETIADLAVAGTEADLFDLVSQAGAQLRSKLGVEAISTADAVSVRASLPSTPEAARLYAEGLRKLRIFDALAARDLLDRSVADDPKYPLSHAALAEAWAMLGYDRKANDEAKQAFQLSKNLAREEQLLVEGRYREINHEHETAIGIYRTLFTLFPDNLDHGLKLANAQTHGAKANDALATVAVLRKLPLPLSDDARIDLEEAEAWGALSDFKHEQAPLKRALEKGRAQGSRLLVARVLHDQCYSFSFLEDQQNAVAACREARDIYSTAGDRSGEAGALRAWADAIAASDHAESLRLYQEALTIFRSIGFEGGVASVLNNMGLRYQEEGDMAAAEKMHRQAQAIYQRLGAKGSLAAATQNVATERLGQGDLAGAMKLFMQALQLDRESGDTGSAAIADYNIADVLELQGDLAGAKRGFEQAFATFQKNGDQYSSTYALWSLGNLLVSEADFTGARKMFEQSLALRKAGGDKLTVAESQLGLAELSMEEGDPASTQEATLRQVIEVFQQEKELDDEAQAWSDLARALLAENKPSDARETMQRARALAAKSQNPESRWQVAIAGTRVESSIEKGFAHSAPGIAAQKELASIIAKSHELGYQGIELDARLALAEIEMKSGRLGAGRAHLASIETEAKAKGYNLIARKAAAARG